MIQWGVVDYAGMYGTIERWIAIFERMSAGARLDAIGHAKATGELSNAWKQMLAQVVAGFSAQETKLLDLEVSYGKALQLRKDLEANRRYSPELMLTELENLKQVIVVESSKRKFAYIPPPNDKYFEQDRLFGDAVHDRLEPAREDGKDAGNCLATGLYTAAVFHLIRVSEYGLRAVARKLRVTLRDKGKPQGGILLTTRRTSEADGLKPRSERLRL